MVGNGVRFTLASFSLTFVTSTVLSYFDLESDIGHFEATAGAAFLM